MCGGPAARPQEPHPWEEEAGRPGQHRRPRERCAAQPTEPCRPAQVNQGPQQRQPQAVLRIRIHRIHVIFGPIRSGSGSISQRYGSRSESFYH